MHILEPIDFVLLPSVEHQSDRQQAAGKRPAYIVNWSKVYSVFQGIPLELSVAVYDNFSVYVVDGDGLGIAMSGLARVSAWG